MRLAINALTDELRRLKATGVTGISVSDEALGALRKASVPRPASRAPAAPVPPPVVVLPRRREKGPLEALLGQVTADPECAAKIRPGKKVVLGVGNLDASIMFVGRPPEPRRRFKGEPFVGPAGQLLTRMITAMGLARGDVPCISATS